MNNPWDVQAPAGHGDQQEETLYAAVGRALSRWEELEEDLADLFAGFVGAKQRVHDSNNPACRAYGSIPNFSTRADMLNAAADAFFANIDRPALKANYKEVIKQCRGFAARRNEIAHGTRSLNSSLGNLLVPAYYNSRKYAGDDNPAYSYSSKEINYYAGMFAELIGLVRQLEGQVYEVRNGTD